MFQIKTRIKQIAFGLWVCTIGLTSVVWAGERRYFGKDSTHPITFGLEIEINPRYKVGFARALKYYKPDNISSDGWEALSAPERVSFVDAGICLEKIQKDTSKMKPEEKSFYETLPAILDREASGTHEFKGFVFQELDELKNFARAFQNYIYEGDIQGHVVFDFAPLPGAAGYAIYEHDRAMIQRLVAERNESLVVPSRIPGVNFTALYLGPMMAREKYQLAVMEQASLRYPNIAEFTSSRELRRINVWHDVGSVRTYRVAAPSLRTMSYPAGKIGFELRMEDNPASNDRPYTGAFERVSDAMDRLSYVLAEAGSLNPFIDFGQVELPNAFLIEGKRSLEIERRTLAYSQMLQLYESRLLKSLSGLRQLGSSLESAEDWRRFQEIKDRLTLTKTLFKNMFTLDKYLDGEGLGKFLFPLRQWEKYPLLNHLSDRERAKVERRIKKQGLIYLQKWVSFLEGQEQSRGPARTVIQLRWALAEWASAVDLFQYFESFEKANQLPPFQQ